MTRQEANREILRVLAQEIEKFPDGRFHQILQNLNIIETEVEFDRDGKPTGQLRIIDQYHEESTKTLERIKINLNL
jgi:hypothetical protein